MGTIADKLQNIVDSKAAISAAIEAKGGTVPTKLTGYGAAIEALPSGGGSSDLANKLIDRSITEVTAADLSGVTTVGRRAFAYCPSLTSMVIPDNVTTIDSEILTYSNTDWKTLHTHTILSVEIGNGVSAIGSKAFSYVGNVNSTAFTALKIYFKPDRQTIPTLGTDAFKGTGLTIYDPENPGSGIIFVPAALYDEWKAAPNWSTYANQIAPL